MNKDHVRIKSSLRRTILVSRNQRKYFCPDWTIIVFVEGGQDHLCHTTLSNRMKPALGAALLLSVARLVGSVAD